MFVMVSLCVIDLDQDVVPVKGVDGIIVQMNIVQRPFHINIHLLGFVRYHVSHEHLHELDGFC